LVPRERLDRVSKRRGIPDAIERRGQGASELTGIARFDENAVLARGRIVNKLRNAADVRRDDRTPRCQRFENDVRAALAPARKNENVRRAHPDRNLVVESPPAEGDDAEKAKFLGEPFHFGVAVAASDDREVDVATTESDEFGHGPNEDVGTF